MAPSHFLPGVVILGLVTYALYYLVRNRSDFDIDYDAKKIALRTQNWVGPTELISVLPPRETKMRLGLWLLVPSFAFLGFITLVIQYIEFKNTGYWRGSYFELFGIATVFVMNVFLFIQIRTEIMLYRYGHYAPGVIIRAEKYPRRIRFFKYAFTDQHGLVRYGQFTNPISDLSVNSIVSILYLTQDPATNSLSPSRFVELKM